MYLSLFSLQTLAIAIAVSLVWHFVRIRKYPSAPGPLLARITSLWYLKSVLDGKFESWNTEQHRRHGKVIRLAPGWYSLDDPEAHKIVYGTNSSFIKTTWASYFADPSIGPEDGLFAVQDPKVHAAMRKRQAPLYSMTSVKSYQPWISETISQLVEQFDHLCNTGETIDLQSWMQSYAFDAISQMTYGRDHGFIKGGGKDIEGIMRWLERTISFATILGMTFPWGFPLCIYLFGLPLHGMKKFIGKLNKEAEEEAARNRPDAKSYQLESSRPATFFEKTEWARRNNPDDYREYRIQSSIKQNLMAGSDTTSIALTSIIYYSLSTKNVWKRMQDELRDALARGEISENPITFDQTLKLPYLQMVMKEAMRIHSTTGLPSWRLVPAGGATLCGTYFPAGTWVGINGWVAHRNKEVFSPEPDVFNPDRWNPELHSKDKLDQMESYYQAFGSGSRTCIGRHIATMVVSILVPELVRRYTFELTDPDKEVETHNNWFVKQRNLNARILASPL